MSAAPRFTRLSDLLMLQEHSVINQDSLEVTSAWWMELKADLLFGVLDMSLVSNEC